MLNDEVRHKIFRIIQENPEINQRTLADKLGISLGKTNYCIQALIEKGWLKVNNFKNSNNKFAYAYLLTPSGIEEKALLTVSYLKRKIEEYEELKSEIEVLSKEVGEEFFPAKG